LKRMINEGKETYKQKIEQNFQHEKGIGRDELREWPQWGEK